MAGKFSLGFGQDARKGQGIGDVELPGCKSSKRGQMRSAADFLAEIMGEGADVRSLGAGNSDSGGGFFIRGDAKSVDMNQARLTFDFLLERYPFPLGSGQSREGVRAVIL